MASTFDTRDYGYVKTDNIFGGQSPTSTWDSTSNFGVNYGGVPSYDWGSTSGIDTGLINNIAFGKSNSSSGTDWLNKGLEALNKAMSYKNQAGASTSSGSRSYRGYGSNAPAVSQGRGYTMFMPTPTQKTTQSGGSRGIGGALGTIAGIGVSMIPGVGQAAAAAAPALGGTLGGFFG